jgi:hypothetical protein
MLIREAKWFATRMAALPDDALFPMLNLGSQTGEFRKTEQPWLERYIFEPLERRGEVVHTDLQTGEGIELSGDLSDPAFRERLRSLRFQSIVCSNLLEHVANRDEFVRYITPILPVGGLLFVSVPNRFPYHPDPIDTLYRPTPAELAALFPGTEIVDKAIVNCGTYTRYLVSSFCWSPLRMLGKFVPRRMKPAATPGTPVADAGSPVKRLFPWLFRSFRASCIILRKTSEDA